MKKVIALAVLLGAATLIGHSKYCLGVWCPSFGCFSRCNAQCACVSRGAGPGTCISIQWMDSIAEEGWVELK